MIYDHAAKPGPMYWSWRCLTCGKDVSEHATWLQRLVRRLRWWSDPDYVARAWAKQHR